MRILLASKYSPLGNRPIGGVQSWVQTVAVALQRLGHKVTVWSPETSVPAQFWDLGILANHGNTGDIWDRCERRVNVVHGIIPAEAPGPAHSHVFTSEGVRFHWGLPGRIVRQPIDLEYWAPAVRRRSGLFRYSYRAGLAWLPGMAALMGMPYRHERRLTHDAARTLMQGSACVLATGRAALESMACGAPVVICDHRSAYQGPLMDTDTFGAMTRNYSGRGGVEPTPERLRQAVLDAMEAGSMRHHVERHHDAAKIAEELLQC